MQINIFGIYVSILTTGKFKQTFYQRGGLRHPGKLSRGDPQHGVLKGTSENGI